MKPEEPPLVVTRVGKYEVKFGDKVSLKIEKKDIVQADSCVIVNPANIYLEHKGGVSGQIVLQGGKQI